MFGHQTEGKMIRNISCLVVQNAFRIKQKVNKNNGSIQRVHSIAGGGGGGGGGGITNNKYPLSNIVVTIQKA